MYRSLFLLMTFVAVTLGLILLQPELNEPTVDVVPTVDPAAGPEPTLTATFRPILRPEGIDVTRAETPLLTLGSVDVEAPTQSLASLRPTLRPLLQAEEVVPIEAEPVLLEMPAPVALPVEKIEEVVADALEPTDPLPEPVINTEEVIAVTAPEVESPAAIATADKVDDTAAPLQTTVSSDGTLRLSLMNLADTIAPVPAPQVTPTPTPILANHTVRLGDTLENIAQRYYGDRAYAAQVAEANKDMLADAQDLPRGLTLRIPQIDAD